MQVVNKDGGRPSACRWSIRMGVDRQRAGEAIAVSVIRSKASCQ